MDRGLKLGNAGKASKAALLQLVGTPSQIEWAEQIRRGSPASSIACPALCWRWLVSNQNRTDQTPRRLSPFSRRNASRCWLGLRQGYFIRDWQELTDQVLRVIRKDPRYQAIRLAKQSAIDYQMTVEGLMLPQQETVKGDLHHEHSTLIRPHRGEADRGTGKPQRHHHPRFRQGETAGGRSHRRRPWQEARGRQNGCRSTSKSATASCSESTPAARPSWMAPSTSSCARTMCSAFWTQPERAKAS